MIPVWPGQVSTPRMGVPPEWAPTEGEAAPTSIVWQGVLLAPEDGEYRFRLETTGQGSLSLDGAAVATVPGQAEGAVWLARGRHALWAQVAPGGEAARVAWWPPDESDWQAVPRRYLYHWPVEAGGLLGAYLPGAGDDWDTAAFRRIDPSIDFYFHILPLERPYRVRWQGWLRPPVPGDYTLTLQARDRAELWLGGVLALVTGAPESPVNITASLSTPVAIEVRFWDETNYTSVSLRWTRPDGVEEVIPYTALAPPLPVVAAR